MRLVIVIMKLFVLTATIASVSAAELENIALGATARASSVYQDYQAENAIDGEISDDSRWLSTTGPGSEWIEINFTEEYRVGGLHIFSGWERSSPIRNFKIEFKREGEWVDIPSAIFFDNDRLELSVEFDETIVVETRAIRVVADLGDGERTRVREIAIWPYSPEGIPRLIQSQSRYDAMNKDIPKIYLNQSGFNIGMPKRFTAPLLDDGTPFQVREAGSDKIVYEGTIIDGIGDFSSIDPNSASEYLVTTGDETSVPFRIGHWWVERVSYQGAVDFMADSRHYLGSHRGVCPMSYAWRDSVHFAFEVNSLSRMYMSNPSAYERMPKQIFYEAPSKDREGLWGALKPYSEEAPDVVKMMHWGADVILSQQLDHMLFKEQLAHFLYSWPWVEQWLPRQNYEAVLAYTRSMWANPNLKREYRYDTVTENHDLFEVKTDIGTTKGENPPGHNVLPNLLMYEVSKRENLPEADRYFAAAFKQVEWMIDNLDWKEPILTKGQRQGERITVIGLAQMARQYPDLAPAGLSEFIQEWIDVIISRSDNMWDFRKLSDTQWTPTGTGRSEWNEPGNVLGFPSCILAVLPLVKDPLRRVRLEELVWSHFDNCFGRNPTGRHFSHDAPKEIEGVEHGWFRFYPGGIGQLQDARFVFDGAPKNEHYPYNPHIGDVGWTEGWVNFNTAFNDSLAYLASEANELAASWKKGVLRVQLRAPLNFDYEKIETATVDIVMKDGTVQTMTLRERGANDAYFIGQTRLSEQPAEVRYGHGYLSETFVF